MLADRMMRGEEGSELEARHWVSLRGLLFFGSFGCSPAKLRRA
jgi:hypothetical protein